MKRSAKIIVAALFLGAICWSQSALGEEMAPGFKPPREHIYKPYTNDKCLKNCHGEPGIASGGEDGSVRNLYVELKPYVLSVHGKKGIGCIDCHPDADPNFHPRTGYRDADCRACHSENPQGFHPEGGLEGLKARKVEPPKKEALKGEGWMKTGHARAWGENKFSGGFCNGCHTAHYVKKSDDPESTVHPDNIAATCTGCHPEQLDDVDAGGFLARFRLAAHGKGNLSEKHEVSQCLACHQGEGAHGEQRLTGQACPSCHRAGEEAKGAGGFHIKPADHEQPFSVAMRWLYNALVWGSVAGAFAVLLFLGFTSAYGRKDDGN